MLVMPQHAYNFTAWEAKRHGGLGLTDRVAYSKYDRPLRDFFQ